MSVVESCCIPLCVASFALIRTAKTGDHQQCSTILCYYYEFVGNGAASLFRYSRIYMVGSHTYPDIRFTAVVMLLWTLSADCMHSTGAFILYCTVRETLSK